MRSVNEFNVVVIIEIYLYILYIIRTLQYHTRWNTAMPTMVYFLLFLDTTNGRFKTYN